MRAYIPTPSAMSIERVLLTIIDAVELTALLAGVGAMVLLAWGLR